MSAVIKEGEIERMRRKYPDRIPVVITRSALSDKSVPDIKRHKFLVPSHLTFAELLMVVRKWLTLPPEKGLYVYVIPVDKTKEILPSPSSFLTELYDAHRHRNGVLYVTYALENTFGGGQPVPLCPLLL
jgi:GABA(A) receptor-associated protein